MLTQSRVSDIKRGQRESFLFREFSKLFMEIARENAELRDIHMNRVDTSAEKGKCFVMFYTTKGKEHFQEKLKTLILYKPSMRKAMAQLRQSRFTPDIEFAYDAQFEKQMRIELLLDHVKEQEQS